VASDPINYFRQIDEGVTFKPKAEERTYFTDRVVQGENAIPQRCVVLEFPSWESAESFLEERASSDLHDICERTTNSRILMLEGNAE
jgi:hypothetical protein